MNAPKHELCYTPRSKNRKARRALKSITRRMDRAVHNDATSGRARPAPDTTIRLNKLWNSTLAQNLVDMEARGA
jgi:hypothetical protein